MRKDKTGPSRRALGYVRVSREDPDPDREKWSAPSQRQRIVEHCKKRGYELIGVVEDLNVSGSTPFERRPHWSELADQLKNGDVLIVNELTRLGRKLLPTLQLMNDLTEKGIYIVSLENDFDTTNITGKLLLTIMLSISEFERERTIERLRQVHKEIHRQGRALGCRPAYGYEYDLDTKRFVIVENEADVVRRIFEMKASGYGLSSIARRMQADNIKTKRGSPQWSAQTVRRILSNKRYVGLRTYKGETRPLEIPTIVDLETFQKAQATLGQMPYSKRREYLLSGLLRCDRCKGPLYRVQFREKRSENKQGSVLGANWRCKNYMQQNTCTGTSINEAVAEAGVVSLVFNALDSKEFKEAVARREAFIRNNDEHIEHARRKLALVEEQQLKLVGEFTRKGSTIQRGVFNKQNQILNNMSADLEKEIAEFERETILSKKPVEIDLGSEWETLDIVAKREALRVFLDYVLVLSPGAGVTGIDRLKPVWKYEV